ncbi:MAG: glucosamine--fructose-6-phosphate aminotransferase [Candidatus Thiodiazotropha sp.]
MLRLKQVLQAWGSERFEAMLKQALESLPHHELPLQQGLQHSSQVSEEPIQVMILNMTESAGRINVRLGVFYSGVIAGCNCADDPTPVDTVSEYCVLGLDIDRGTAEAAVVLLDNDSGPSGDG